MAQHRLVRGRRRTLLGLERNPPRPNQTRRPSTRPGSNRRGSVLACYVPYRGLTDFRYIQGHLFHFVERWRICPQRCDLVRTLTGLTPPTFQFSEAIPFFHFPATLLRSE